MQINKIQGNMNFGGIKHSKYNKNYKEAKMSYNKSKQPNNDKSFYFTEKDNFLKKPNMQLSDDTQKYIEGILNDIKTGNANPNIPTCSPAEAAVKAMMENINK